MVIQILNHRRARVVLVAALSLISIALILRIKPRSFASKDGKGSGAEIYDAGDFFEDEEYQVQPNINSSFIEDSISSLDPSHHSPELIKGNDIDGCAYVFYATTDNYACSVLVNMYRLQHVLNTSLPIHVIASPTVSTSMLNALESANATVHIENPPPLAEGSIDWYRDCLLKLLAFKMHIISPGLKRVLVLDADQLILKNLDHLFLLPTVDFAAPRAYWIARDFLSSTFMLINLSTRLWNVVDDAIRSIKDDKYDMDLVNGLFQDTAVVLGGECIVVNSHWEDWNLPNWYHASTDFDVNETPSSNNVSVELVGDTNDTAQSLQTPRYPASHPLTVELYGLYNTSAVLHFFALGKPWQFPFGSVGSFRPRAHPIFSKQFDTWQQTASEVCAL